MGETGDTPMKICKMCGVAKPADNVHFASHMQTKDKLFTYCRPCAYQRQAECTKKRRKREAQHTVPVKNNGRRGHASHEDEPFMTMAEVRRLLYHMPYTEIAALIKEAIPGCMHPTLAAAELKNADYTDMYWIFYALDILYKWHADMSVFRRVLY